jgi:hypothetical protein
MAGSYNHATTKAGNLREPESFAGMIENLGDAYEMAEEMYGMIWLLASWTDSGNTLPWVVEQARQSYRAGLEIARDANSKRPE